LKIIQNKTIAIKDGFHFYEIRPLLLFEIGVSQKFFNSKYLV